MQLNFTVHKPVAILREYLTDMKKYVSVHPVITKISHTEANRYLVYETLKLGWIPYSFTYPVTIELPPETNSVVIRATVMKLTRIQMTFLLKAMGESTVVEETIVINSPLPVKGIIEKIFRTQHTQLFENIGLLP